MKATLLLIALLIGMIGGAQKITPIDTAYWVKQVVYPDTMYYFGEPYARVKEPEPVSLLPEYVSDLLEYERKCQNDSTYQLVYQDPPIKGTMTLLINVFPKWEWVHLTPTFEGFIEFVKTKYKQK